MNFFIKPAQEKVSFCRVKGTPILDLAGAFLFSLNDG